MTNVSSCSFTPTLPKWVKPGVLVKVTKEAVIDCDVLLILENKRHSKLKDTFDDDEHNPSPEYRSKENKSLVYLVMELEVDLQAVERGSTDWYAFMRVLDSDGHFMVMGVRPKFREGTARSPFGAKNTNMFSKP